MTAAPLAYMSILGHLRVMSPILKTLCAALIAFLIDQISKYGVVFGLGLIDLRIIEVAPPYLTFLMGWNTGINFGLFGGSGQTGRWFLVVLSIVAALYLSYLGRSARGWLMPVALGMIIGGALGNGLDRVIHGAVMDFLNVSCCGLRNPFTFNVADIFIFLGVFGVIFQSWRDERQQKG